MAYGSLIDEPGIEIESLIINRIKNIQTPFRIEFARKSASRGNGPTLIPVEEGGSFVNAQILVLKDEICEQDAMDMLWRRETHNENSDRHYNPPKNPTKNSVIIKKIENFNDLESVLYTVIGKNIDNLSPDELSDLAINSVRIAKNDMDGITYLINAKKEGISTPLMPLYEKEILSKTSTRNLKSALIKLKKNP